MTHERSAAWWAGWREAIEFAAKLECPYCQRGIPVGVSYQSLHHHLGGGHWIGCRAHILRAGTAKEEAKWPRA